MSCKIITSKEFKRRKKIDSNHSSSMDEDSDCPSLNWLLTFRLDNLLCPKEDVRVVKRPETPPLIVIPPSESLRDPLGEGYDRKPPYTYTELIERALRDKGELTVKGIYKWISDRFPFFKTTDDRWKNSVRHNLSINPHFRKGSRAANGAGHMWTLAANAMDLLPKREYSSDFEDSYKKPHKSPVHESYKPYFDDFANVIIIDETALATASILPDNDFLLEDTTFLNPVSSEQVIQECGLFSLE